MKKVTHLFIALSMVIGIAGCAGSGAVSTNPDDLVGDWELSPEAGVDGGEEFLLSFNADGTIAGVVRCNRFAGEYSTPTGEDQAGMLSIDTFAATQVTCDGEEADNTVVTVVENVNGFEVRNDNQLVLLSDGTEELVLNRVAAEEGEDA